MRLDRLCVRCDRLYFYRIRLERLCNRNDRLYFYRPDRLCDSRFYFFRLDRLCDWCDRLYFYRLDRLCNRLSMFLFNGIFWLIGSRLLLIIRYGGLLCLLLFWLWKLTIYIFLMLHFLILRLYVLFLISFLFVVFFFVVVLFLRAVSKEWFANFIVNVLPNGAGIDFLHLACVLFSLFTFSNLSYKIAMK
jgi:hypothetical protein